MKKPNVPSMPKVDFASLAADFRNLDPKDVGAWPLAPRVVVLIFLLIALLAAGWWFDWRGQWEELATKRQEEARLKDEYLGKKKQAINLEEYRRQLADIDRTFGALLKQLPNRSEMEALLIDINQAGLGRGLQFELFRPGAEAVRDFYAELPISIRVTGSYHDIGSFAGDIAKLPRIVSLRNISVGSAGKDAGLLALDATATTYRYLDEEEMAQQRRAKAGQKPGGKK